MLEYYDPSSMDYPSFERITKLLLKFMIVRITRIFGDIWIAIRGGVPSGAFNTSHMDSWIMALYFFLFAIWQIHNAPEEEQEELELELMTIINIVVYGDDHLYRKGLLKGSHYFSGKAFADFMLKHFDVRIRDIKDGIPFCSKTKDGWVINWGCTFLKYQFVENPHKGVGQPDFLPFRESREYLVRACFGRVPRPRDVIDTMISVVGHAYATYASNRDAYDRLFVFYAELLSGTPELVTDLPGQIQKRLNNDDLKRLRQAGITVEELASGFPTWEKLIEKNIRDEVYQDNTKISMDYMVDMVDESEYLW